MSEWGAGEATRMRRPAPVVRRLSLTGTTVVARIACWSWGESNHLASMFPHPGQSAALLARAGFRVTVGDRCFPSFRRSVRPNSVLRERSSGDVEEAAQGFADDVAGRGLLGGRACFDCGAQLRVEPNRNHLGWR